MPGHWNAQGAVQGLSGGIWGYKRGYKLTFDFMKPSIHEGFKASFKRFHSTEAFKERFLKAFFIGKSRTYAATAYKAIY